MKNATVAPIVLPIHTASTVVVTPNANPPNVANQKVGSASTQAGMNISPTTAGPQPDEPLNEVIPFRT